MLPMRDSPIDNIQRLGYLVRLRRQEKSLSQAALAARLGVGRKWVHKLEAGNPGAELALVLQALNALGLHLVISEHTHPTPTSQLDEVFRRLRPGTEGATRQEGTALERKTGQPLVDQAKRSES